MSQYTQQLSWSLGFALFFLSVLFSFALSFMFQLYFLLYGESFKSTFIPSNPSLFHTGFHLVIATHLHCISQHSYAYIPPGSLFQCQILVFRWNIILTSSISLLLQSCSMLSVWDCLAPTHSLHDSESAFGFSSAHSVTRTDTLGKRNTNKNKVLSKGDLSVSR